MQWNLHALISLCLDLALKVEQSLLEASMQESQVSLSCHKISFHVSLKIVQEKP